MIKGRIKTQLSNALKTEHNHISNTVNCTIASSTDNESVCKQVFWLVLPPCLKMGYPFVSGNLNEEDARCYFNVCRMNCDKTGRVNSDKTVYHSRIVLVKVYTKMCIWNYWMEIMHQLCLVYGGSESHKSTRLGSTNSWIADELLTHMYKWRHRTKSAYV